MLKLIRKAVAAAGFTAASGLGTAMLDGNLTTAEAVASVGAGLVAGAAVYLIPNGGGRHRAP